MSIIVNQSRNSVNIFDERFHLDNLPNGEHSGHSLEMWKKQSSELALWTQKHLVNRDDTFVKYYQCGTPHTGNARVAKPLTIDELTSHYFGLKDRVGPYSYDQSGHGSWVCIDIDAHKAEDSVFENWADVVGILEECHQWGFKPLVEHSNGKLGFHVWLVFDRKIPCHTLRSIGLYLTRQLNSTPEVFPKQSVATEVGNVVRLPGRHHKRLSWFSEFYDSATGVWHSGADAPAYLLAFVADSADKVPAIAREYLPPVKELTTSVTSGASGDSGTSWERYRGDISTLDIVSLSEGRLQGRGAVWSRVECPWAGQHTTGSTTAYVANGEAWPSFKCHHSHCSERKLVDYLATFEAGEVDRHCKKTFEHKTMSDGSNLVAEWEGSTAGSSREYHDPYADEVDISWPKEAKRNAVPKNRKGITLDDVEKQPDQKWLVKYHFHKGTTGIIMGKEGTGKSFYALHLGVCVATGKEFFGQKTATGKVAYIYSEGTGGLKKRWLAYKKHFMIPNTPENIRFYPFRYDFADAISAEEFLSQVREDFGGDVDLIIIDTLARNFNGSENDGEDMGAFIGSLDYMAASGATVITIHHTGKDATKGSRGHSSLAGAMDGIIELEQSDGNRKVLVSSEKAKDTAQFATYSLVKKSIALGFDEDGDEITSLVLVPEDNHSMRFRLLKTERKAYITALHEKYGFEAISYSDATAITLEPKSTQADHLKALVSDGLLTKYDKKYFISDLLRPLFSGGY